MEQNPNVIQLSTVAFFYCSKLLNLQSQLMFHLCPNEWLWQSVVIVVVVTRLDLGILICTNGYLIPLDHATLQTSIENVMLCRVFRDIVIKVSCSWSKENSVSPSKKAKKLTEQRTHPMGWLLVMFLNCCSPMSLYYYS